MSDILDKVRKINWLLQETPSGAFSFDELCKILGNLMKANIYVLDYDGTLFGVSVNVPEENNLILNEETGLYYLSEDSTEKLNNVDATMANLKDHEVQDKFGFKFTKPNKYYTVIPVVGGGKKWGTIAMTRLEPEFTDEDLALGELGATIVGLVIFQRKMMKEREEAQEKENVQMAIGTLSYSETEAVQRIFAELEGDEGILVASRIADKSGITRSVIVNALRKLESASVIETRSLGMKGTRIKILNPMLKSELEKVK